MMKKIIIITATMLMFITATQAQQLGLGGMINHTSTGILFTYSPNWEKNWHLDLGLRYFAKVNLIGKNEQSFAYYQQGYTEHFWEKFAANVRISHKIARYKFIRLDFMANLLVTCESRLETGSTFGTDPRTGQFGEIWPYDYYKPSPAAELTIGPALNIDCCKKIAIYGAVGFGMIYMHHSHTGWSRAFNEPVTSYDIDLPNWKRGSYEMVGLDGLPMISFGVKYKIK